MFSVGAATAPWTSPWLRSVSQQTSRPGNLSLKASIGYVRLLYEFPHGALALQTSPVEQSSTSEPLSRIRHLQPRFQGFRLVLGVPSGKHWTATWAFALHRHVGRPEFRLHLYQAQAGRRPAGGDPSVVRDTTDVNIFPSKGSKNSPRSITTAAPSWDASATPATASPPPGFSPILTMSLRSAADRLHAGQRGKRDPIYERYTLGGISSLRGLRVGTKDPPPAMCSGAHEADLQRWTTSSPSRTSHEGGRFFDTGDT
jgi:hypothetical protein